MSLQVQGGDEGNESLLGGDSEPGNKTALIFCNPKMMK